VDRDLLPKYDKVVWISLDTLRADCIGFNKAKLFPREYKTKTKLKKNRLDWVCSKGFLFNNAISAAPYTSASHAAYFTGLWPKNNGVYDQFNSKLKAETVFDMAKVAGFTTIFKTDFPFILGKYLNMISSIDHYFIEDDEQALRELKKRKQVFSFFHFGQIHYPYGFHNLTYGGKDYKKKVAELEKKYRIKTTRMNLDDMAIETFRKKKDLSLLYRYKKIVSFLYKNHLDDDLFDLYLEGINYFHDKKFNRFLNTLLKILDGTNYLVIISSDHGEAWNDNTYGHHNSLDEGVIRVPVLFYAPNIKPKVYSNRIRTIDVVPTLNQVLFKNKRKFDGKSLDGIIYSGTVEKDRDAFSAVWVNESKEVIKKIKQLLGQGHISTNPRLSVKYSEALYQGNIKFVKQHKKFMNRSEVLSDCLTSQASKIGPLEKIIECRLTKKTQSEMITRIRKYNAIKVQKRMKKTENIRDYFNLLGYRI